MEKTYMPRVPDALLAERLDSAGAVLIEGPKWCGKTSTAARAAQSAVYLQDPDKAASYALAIDTKPSLLLRGAAPRLIDEWQTAPVLWDAVRMEVDRRGLAGQFILTGSAVPRDDAVMHTGTGRISRLLLRPMSLQESGESNGSVRLSQLFEDNPEIDGTSGLDIEHLAEVIVRGGWPASVGAEKRVAMRHTADYVDAVIHTDVSRVDGVRRDPQRARALLRSLSRNICTQASLVAICDDIASSEGSAQLSEKTVRQYLNALERIFVTEDLPAWNPVLRSRTRIRTTSTRHFVDPSIPAAVFGLSPAALLEDFPYFGLLFEELCVRDLRTYAEALDARVYHYRDRSDLEADAVVVRPDGRWGAVEAKLGMRQAEEAARHLLQLADKVDADRMRPPSFLMVLTGGELAYRRKDGVCVVPIGCLGC